MRNFMNIITEAAVPKHMESINQFLIKTTDGRVGIESDGGNGMWLKRLDLSDDQTTHTYTDRNGEEYISSRAFYYNWHDLMDNKKGRATQMRMLRDAIELASAKPTRSSFDGAE